MSIDLDCSSNLHQGGRIDILDALRGLAMLGIMIVNFPSINTFATKETVKYTGIATPIDSFFAQLNFILFNGKFYPIFATLFGLGCWIFYQNALAKNLNAKHLLTRRLAALAGFGILHVLFVWWGDILLFYAMLGMILMLFMNLKAENVLKAMIYCLVVFPCCKIFLDLLNYFNIISLTATAFNGFTNFNFSNEYLLSIYSQGSFAQIAEQRMIDYVHDFTFLFEKSITYDVLLYKTAYVIQVFGCFLLGLYAGKMQWHKNLTQKIPQIKRLWFIFAGFSAIFSIFAFSPVFSFMKYEVTFVQGEFFSIFYILSFVLALNKYKASPIFSYFQAVGRMSFTSYIAHTTAASLILYSYGWALFAKIGPAQLFFISLSYYIVVAALCKLWLQKFKFGPFEYAWRRITYSNLKQATPTQKSRGQTVEA